MKNDIKPQKHQRPRSLSKKQTISKKIAKLKVPSWSSYDLGKVEENSNTISLHNKSIDQSYEILVSSSEDEDKVKVQQKKEIKTAFKKRKLSAMNLPKFTMASRCVTEYGDITDLGTLTNWSVSKNLCNSLDPELISYSINLFHKPGIGEKIDNDSLLSLVRDPEEVGQPYSIFENTRSNSNENKYKKIRIPDLLDIEEVLGTYADVHLGTVVPESEFYHLRSVMSHILTHITKYCTSFKKATDLDAKNKKLSENEVQSIENKEISQNEIINEINNTIEKPTNILTFADNSVSNFHSKNKNQLKIRKLYHRKNKCLFYDLRPKTSSYYKQLLIKKNMYQTSSIIYSSKYQTKYISKQSILTENNYTNIESFFLNNIRYSYLHSNNMNFFLNFKQRNIDLNSNFLNELYKTLSLLDFNSLSYSDRKYYLLIKKQISLLSSFKKSNFHYDKTIKFSHFSTSNLKNITFLKNKKVLNDKNYNTDPKSSFKNNDKIFEYSKFNCSNINRREKSEFLFASENSSVDNSIPLSTGMRTLNQGIFRKLSENNNESQRYLGLARTRVVIVTPYRYRVTSLINALIDTAYVNAFDEIEDIDDQRKDLINLICPLYRRVINEYGESYNSEDLIDGTHLPSDADSGHELLLGLSIEYPHTTECLDISKTSRAPQLRLFRSIENSDIIIASARSINKLSATETSQLASSEIIFIDQLESSLLQDDRALQDAIHKLSISRSCTAVGDASLIRNSHLLKCSDRIRQIIVFSRDAEACLSRTMWLHDNLIKEQCFLAREKAKHLTDGDLVVLGSQSNFNLYEGDLNKIDSEQNGKTQKNKNKKRHKQNSNMSYNERESQNKPDEFQIQAVSEALGQSGEIQAACHLVLKKCNMRNLRGLITINSRWFARSILKYIVKNDIRVGIVACEKKDLESPIDATLRHFLSAPIELDKPLIIVPSEADAMLHLRQLRTTQNIQTITETMSKTQQRKAIRRFTGSSGIIVTERALYFKQLWQYKFHNVVFLTPPVNRLLYLEVLDHIRRDNTSTIISYFQNDASVAHLYGSQIWNEAKSRPGHTVFLN